MPVVFHRSWSDKQPKDHPEPPHVSPERYNICITYSGPSLQPQCLVSKKFAIYMDVAVIASQSMEETILYI